jgi:hypothetical protein
MSNYADLKSKWQDLLKKGEAGCAFDYDKLSPGKFVLHLTDCGGYSMSSYSCTEVTGFFNEPLDALAFLRWVQIPRAMDFDTCTDKPQPEVADAYLLKYDSDERKLIDHVIGLIDQAMIAGFVSIPKLERIREEFNAAFYDTNPEVQIMAWGDLLQTLCSDYFREAVENDILEEVEESEKPSTVLKGLLDSGNFNESNDQHLSMAENFFARHNSY